MADVTQAQYAVSKQPYRNLRIRIELLNFSYQTIDRFDGNLISGSITSDANSNMRNTCDISLIVTDSTFNVEAQGKIWIDRLIKIYVGVDSIQTGDTIWINKGIYLINQPTYQYDSATNTLSFQGVDLMGMLTGLRGGMLMDSYSIPQGSNVRSAIIAILTLNGFSKYVVSECQNVDGAIQSVPYDMEFDQGKTWWDVLSEMLDILPNYQMYFDTDGVFHYETIPYTKNEIIRIDDDIWDENVISESVSYDFESVKNSVKVLGKTHDIKYFPSSLYVSDNNISMNISALSSLFDKAMIGFVPDVEVNGNITLNVNGYGAKQLVSNGVQITHLDADIYYVAVYDESNDVWDFMGHIQAVGAYKDENPDSPFYVGNPAGEISIVLYGGDYDNIASDDLALVRAKWEIYQRCRLNDSINLTTVPIYWAEVNWMVSYTPLGEDIVRQYLIRSISTDLSCEGTQTYNLVRYYPYYDEI